MWKFLQPFNPSLLFLLTVISRAKICLHVQIFFFYEVKFSFYVYKNVFHFKLFWGNGRVNSCISQIVVVESKPCKKKKRSSQFLVEKSLVITNSSLKICKTFLSPTLTISAHTMTFFSASCEISLSQLRDFNSTIIGISDFNLNFFFLLKIHILRLFWPLKMHNI